MKPKMINIDGKLFPADGTMDAGLLMLSLVTPRGVERSLREIADVCGCRWQAIHYIEQCALRKIRQEFTRRGIL